MLICPANSCGVGARDQQVLYPASNASSPELHLDSLAYPFQQPYFLRYIQLVGHAELRLVDLVVLAQ